jgi:CRISPR-associated protein Cas2
MMFVIMVYDANEKRVTKVLKTARKYLTWMQNSLLEGDITEAKFENLKREIKQKTVKEEDSIIWYTFQSKKFFRKEEYGLQKGEVNYII